jgi:hypothetical protein
MTKHVSFQPEKDQEVFSIDTNDELDLWFSRQELEDSRKNAKLASLAVNDACGDFDVTDEAETCIKTVLQKQTTLKPEDLARITQELSASSVELARLYALVLEKDIQDSEPVTYEVLLDIVNSNVLIAGPDDEDDDDSESIGTIDELPFPETCYDDSISDFDFCERTDPMVSTTVCVSQNEIISSKGELEKLGDICSFGGDKSYHQTFQRNLDNIPDMKCFSKNIECESKNYDLTTSLSKKRALSSTPLLREETHSSNVVGGKSFDIEPRKRQRGCYKEETQNRCNVAYALISLARWEFRGHKVSVL